jgi:hypothetical protein
MNLDNYVSVKDYARMHNLSPATVRQRIHRGSTKAVKVGRDWFIRKDEPLIDNRVSTKKG